VETRVFDFEVDFGAAGNVVGLLVLRVPGVDRVSRSMDDLLAAGWRPVHWTTLPSEMSSVAKYRVVMQRARASTGDVEPSTLQSQSLAAGMRAEPFG
jgi:hypothetical protein